MCASLTKSYSFNPTHHYSFIFVIKEVSSLGIGIIVLQSERRCSFRQHKYPSTQLSLAVLVTVSTSSQFFCFICARLLPAGWLSKLVNHSPKLTYILTSFEYILYPSDSSFSFDLFGNRITFARYFLILLGWSSWLSYLSRPFMLHWFTPYSYSHCL